MCFDKYMMLYMYHHSTTQDGSMTPTFPCAAPVVNPPSFSIP